MGGHLDLPHRLHQRILHRDTDVASAISLTQLCQRLVVLLAQLAIGVANANLKHAHPCWRIWQVDVDPSLEPSSDGGVELPWDVRRTQDEDPFGVFAHTVHLHQQLCLYTS
jgi:hypothetical protein